jgi:carboxyl-terminal processing protease
VQPRRSLIALLGVFVLSSLGAFVPLRAAQTAPAQQLFDTSLELLSANYHGYARFDAEALRATFQPRLLGACRGQEACDAETGGQVVTEMIASLRDPHTYRLTPQQTRARDLEFSGGGGLSLGLKLAAVPDAPALVIVRVLQGGAADSVELKRGDLIWAVNGQPLSNFSSSQAALDAIQTLETAGAPLQLSIGRGKARLEVVVKPAPGGVWLPQLETRGDVGIISFFQFKTSGAVAARVHQLVLQAQRQSVKSLVLDVRDCQGGLVTEMLGAVGAFVDHPVLVDEFKTGQVRFEFQQGSFVQTDPDGQRYETPMISPAAHWAGRLTVLTNRAAKSAPEYLAFMLQRLVRATVIGEPTLGALNTSNSFFSLPDNSSLAITVGRSLFVDGRPYPERVTPDVPVTDDITDLATGRDAPLEVALRGTISPGSTR